MANINNLEHDAQELKRQVAIKEQEAQRLRQEITRQADRNIQEANRQKQDAERLKRQVLQS